MTAHSEKENTAPNFKRGFGFHPLLAFADHGPDGTGEPLSFLLRPGNAGSNTAAHHISVTRAALAQLPFRTSGAVGKKILIRSDGAGGTHAFLEYLTARKLSYSVGFTLTDSMAEAVDEIPEDLWISALDSNGDIRGGAWVAELTGLVHLSAGLPVSGSLCAKNDLIQALTAVHGPKRSAPDRIRDQHCCREPANPGVAAPSSGSFAKTESARPRTPV